MSYILDKVGGEFIRETSHKALNLMSEYNVIPSPMNYQTWFTYEDKTDLSLAYTIDNMIERGTVFDIDICTNLHQKFFTGELMQHSITEAGEGFQNELVKLVKTLKQSSDGTLSYSDSLSEHLENLEDVTGGPELKKIIGGLLSDTRKMEDQNNSMKRELKASAQEVQKLQSNLETALHENITDALTNIGNRRCFENSLKAALKNAQAKGESFCLLFADIDHFKEFNDTWGHQVGDQVLKAVAHTLKTHIGQQGIPSRYGGEEFVMVLPNIDLQKAFFLADTIRDFINQRPMKRKSSGETIGKVSISIGIAQYHSGDNRDSLLKRADSALYLAKNSGRNVVKTERHMGDDNIHVA